MKHLLKAALAALALLLAAGACQRAETRVQSVAETFLSAYYTGDYAAAATACTPAFAKAVRYSAPDAALPEETVQKIKEALSRTSFEIVSVTVDKDAASAVVRYDLSVPGLGKPVPKALSLQLEGRTALVDGIQ